MICIYPFRSIELLTIHLTVRFLNWKAATLNGLLELSDDLDDLELRRCPLWLESTLTVPLVLVPKFLLVLILLPSMKEVSASRPLSEPQSARSESESDTCR